MDAFTDAHVLGSSLGDITQAVAQVDLGAVKDTLYEKGNQVANMTKDFLSNLVSGSAQSNW